MQALVVTIASSTSGVISDTAPANFLARLPVRIFRSVAYAITNGKFTFLVDAGECWHACLRGRLPFSLVGSSGNLCTVAQVLAVWFAVMFSPFDVVYRASDWAAVQVSAPRASEW